MPDCSILFLPLIPLCLQIQMIKTCFSKMSLTFRSKNKTNLQANTIILSQMSFPIVFFWAGERITLCSSQFRIQSSASPCPCVYLNLTSAWQVWGRQNKSKWTCFCFIYKFFGCITDRFLSLNLFSCLFVVKF